MGLGFTEVGGVDIFGKTFQKLSYFALYLYLGLQQISGEFKIEFKINFCGTFFVDI